MISSLMLAAATAMVTPNMPSRKGGLAHRLRVLPVIVMAAILVALANPGSTATATTAFAPEEAFFTFHVPPHPETFVIKLTDPGTIQEARDILRGRQPHRMVTGRIVKQPAEYNPPWTFHLDPSSIEFAEVAIEVCDAAIQYVQEHLDEACGAFLPGCAWCPWGSRLIAEDKRTTFPETGYSLHGEFLSYWNAHGGLQLFGYPIDSERQVGGRVTQWLERARFELYPENLAPYNVLLGRLGVEALERQGRAWQNFPRAAPDAPHYFQETGHAIAHAPFWQYWSSHGLEFDRRLGTSIAESLALFGYPISEAQMERNSSGDAVLTQWFERARFEYHPNNPAAFQVLLGRLGAELRGDRR